jgi:hypothetical protein
MDSETRPNQEAVIVLAVLRSNKTHSKSIGLTRPAEINHSSSLMDVAMQTLHLPLKVEHIQVFPGHFFLHIKFQINSINLPTGHNSGGNQFGGNERSGIEVSLGQSKYSQTANDIRNCV